MRSGFTETNAASHFDRVSCRRFRAGRLTDLGRVHKLSAEGATTWNLTEGVDALSVLVTAVERAIEAGRIRPQDPTPVATQILSATHGFVLLAMSGFIDPRGPNDVMAPMAINLMVGLGDTRRRAERSLAAAIEAMSNPTGSSS